jgi:hypothetical protein
MAHSDWKARGNQIKVRDLPSGIFRSFSATKGAALVGEEYCDSRRPEATDLLAEAVNITSAVTESTVAQSFRLLLYHVHHNYYLSKRQWSMDNHTSLLLSSVDFENGQ